MDSKIVLAVWALQFMTKQESHFNYSLNRGKREQELISGIVMSHCHKVSNRHAHSPGEKLFIVSLYH